jgi:hypothetical protein
LDRLLTEKRGLAPGAGGFRSFATNNNLSAQFYSLKAAPDKTNVAQALPGRRSGYEDGGKPPLR